MTRGFRIGVIGAGAFARDFVPLLLAHPSTESVIVADRHADRRAAFERDFGVATRSSAEALIDSEVDAVAIFVQRHLHGPLAIAALAAGKHVYSAVPMASSIEQMERIIELSAAHRLIYMMGETCHYYPAAVYCRREHRRGAFGDFVYAESQYIHDMRHGFYDAFRHSGGADWRRVAGFPPMFYSTHTVAPVLAATGARVTAVSCMGVEDRSGDGVFGVDSNEWSNPFSNQVAVHRLSNGGLHRVVEFRRAGIRPPGTHIGFFVGTEGAYEAAGTRHLHHAVHEDARMTVTDVSALLNEREVEAQRAAPGMLEAVANGLLGGSRRSPILDGVRLPAGLADAPTSHRGTPPILVDDFMIALRTGLRPPMDAWAAANATVPGILSHESAVKGGMLLEVPDMGVPPRDWGAFDREAQFAEPRRGRPRSVS